jgi:hypothetical protein
MTNQNKIKFLNKRLTILTYIVGIVPFSIFSILAIFNYFEKFKLLYAYITVPFYAIYIICLVIRLPFFVKEKSKQ